MSYAAKAPCIAVQLWLACFVPACAKSATNDFCIGRLTNHMEACTTKVYQGSNLLIISASTVLCQLPLS